MTPGPQANAAPNAAQLLAALAPHQGASMGISVAALARKLGLEGECGQRTVRKLVAELREDGTAVCAHPSTGYFIAATPEELSSCCEFLHRRAMSSLRQAARMQRISLAELAGQLNLNQA